jgi:hypothetical protein
MVQIAFLTLFLGLTSGRQPVALTVQGPVAAVELVLDGTAVLRVGPPWRTKIDFGTALEPHELIARALDDKGQEVGRVRQVINLPRPPAEVEILLENDAKGQPAGAHLTWHSLTGEKPAAVSLLLDGQPVGLDGNAHAALPPVDPEVSHILSAEVRFGAAVVARKDIGFGGRWGDEVSTELTAVPVRLRPGKILPPAAALQGWVLTDGKPVPVAAVEESRAQLLVVRDNEARLALENYDRQKAGKSLQAGIGERQRFQMTLGKDDQIRFVWPSAKSFTGQGVPAELFDASRDYTGKDGGLLWLLGRALPQTEKFDQRLADATAVAGLQALAGNRPRAVLLVLGYNAKDVSRYDAGAVRHYLESVRVPLIIWALDRASLAASAWGGAEDISTLPKLESTFKKLNDELAWQRILWVEGSHLPRAISLSPAAAEVLELVR